MWFSACLLFENVGQSRPISENIWEERIVLFRAANDDEAKQRALAIGVSAQHKYVAANGESIDCQFRQVERIVELATEQVDDETEVFSRFLRYSEVQSLLTPFPD